MLYSFFLSSDDDACAAGEQRVRQKRKALVSIFRQRLPENRDKSFFSPAVPPILVLRTHKTRLVEIGIAPNFRCRITVQQPSAPTANRKVWFGPPS